MSSVPSTMTAKTKEQLSIVFANLIDIKSRLLRHCTLWCIKGPSLGASAGVTAIVQEEDGHVTILRKLRDAQGLNGAETAVSIPYLQETPKTWTQLIVDLYMFDTFASRVITNFKNSSSDDIANTIPKMIEEELYHEQFSKEWALILAASDNFKQEFADEFKRALISYDGMADHFRSDALVQERIIAEEIGAIHQTYRDEMVAEFAKRKDIA